MATSNPSYEEVVAHSLTQAVFGRAASASEVALVKQALAGAGPTLAQLVYQAWLTPEFQQTVLPLAVAHAVLFGRGMSGAELAGWRAMAQEAGLSATLTAMVGASPFSSVVGVMSGQTVAEVMARLRLPITSSEAEAVAAQLRAHPEAVGAALADAVAASSLLVKSAAALTLLASGLAGSGQGAIWPDAAGVLPSIEGVLARFLPAVPEGGTGLGRTVVGTTRNDLLSGGAGNDLLQGDLGDDTLQGGDGNDRLSGDAGSDRLEGGSGNDTLIGASGADTLVGGSGSDRFVLDDVASRDVVLDFAPGAGGDVLDLTAIAGKVSWVASVGRRASGAVSGWQSDKGAAVLRFDGVAADADAVAALFSPLPQGVFSPPTGPASAVVIADDGRSGAGVWWVTWDAAGSSQAQLLATLVGVAASSLVAANVA
ncbi:calcium-binding protein [Hydrogenophilus thiooxidans]|uniref:calcium-binding protein n=1 Tax=Hydrogenophilus thiooxidans TaxID=2820326 RepID=UPI001C211BC9|nr:calcium-binding protein [Hydrogenophilus thiooxidans]